MGDVFVNIFSDIGLWPKYVIYRGKSIPNFIGGSSG